MATQVARPVVAQARRPAVSAGVPVLAATITAPGVPDWVTKEADMATGDQHSPELQRIRGPYPIAASVAAYAKHLGLDPQSEAARRPG